MPLDPKSSLKLKQEWLAVAERIITQKRAQVDQTVERITGGSVGSPNPTVDPNHIRGPRSDPLGDGTIYEQQVRVSHTDFAATNNLRTLLSAIIDNLVNGSFLVVEEGDGAPSGEARTIIVPNGSATYDGATNTVTLDWALSSHDHGQYRSPVYQTYGGGSYLFDASGDAIYVLRELE